jgi:hypothetical protein
MECSQCGQVIGSDKVAYYQRHNRETGEKSDPVCVYCAPQPFFDDRLSQLEQELSDS